MFSEYLGTTTIHGLRYLSPKETGHFGRLIWTVFITVQFILTGFFIRDAVNSWEENPKSSKLTSQKYLEFRASKQLTLLYLQVTSAGVVRFSSVPFPDVTVCAIGSTYWREVFNMAAQLDTDNEVFALFNSSSFLRAFLATSVKQMAEFLVVKDFTVSFLDSPVLIDEDLWKAGKEAKNAICQDGKKRVPEDLYDGERLTLLIDFAGEATDLWGGKNGTLEDRTQLRSAGLTKCLERRPVEPGESETKFCHEEGSWADNFAQIVIAQEMILYKHMTKENLLVLLLKLLNSDKSTLMYRTALLPEIEPVTEAQQDIPNEVIVHKDDDGNKSRILRQIKAVSITPTDLHLIYEYLTNLSRRTRRFGGLPLPVALSLLGSLSLDVVKTTFQATDPDVYVYDPTHALNYGLKEWGDTYQSFYRCLTSFSKMASEDCKHLDSFFQDVVEEENFEAFADDLSHHVSNERSLEAVADLSSVPMCYWRDKLMGLNMSVTNLGYRIVMCDRMRRMNILPFCFTFPGKDYYSRTINADSGLVLVLDRSFGEIIPGDYQYKGDHFDYLAFIHEHTDFPDYMDGSSISLKLEAGRVNDVVVDGYIFNSTRQFDSMSNRYRNCLTTEEAEERAKSFNFFDHYTKKTCHLDYQWSIISNGCNKSLPSHIKMRHNLGGKKSAKPSDLLCIEHYIDRTKSLDFSSSGCVVRCNRIYYTADVTAGKKVFDLERYFRDNHDRIVETKNMPLYSYISDTKRYNVMNLVSLDGNQPLIKERLEKITVVRLNFAKAFLQKLTTDAKATFSDKVSSIGGTLGLFTGFSITSLVEIVFWIARAAVGRRRML